MPNRLANETSPYLLQHQNNPVDWYPWGPEAFAKAESEGKPIFLSVGYSSCHWCHVMEHESFESPEIAAILNEFFVSIKVDREERPDVDEAYMTAVQLSSGRGGWPMSVFLTPDKKPFYAGTYYPKEDRGQHSGFETVLKQISGVWGSERGKAEEVAEQFADAIRKSVAHEIETEAINLGAELLDTCVQAHAHDFDEQNGGFVGAPKFPPHTAIEFFLNYALIEEAPVGIRQTAADMALSTLYKMALGGIHDHVGGGFHRYSTDEHWFLPHFEKMLYDNALMLGNYARAAAMCHGDMPQLEQVFDQTCQRLIGWLRREMMSPEGLFYSALDADSEGEEGKYYVWTNEELQAVLGDSSAAFAETFQFHPQGNFRDEATGTATGANIPHLLEDAGDRFDLDLNKLREARESRIKPGLDDKSIISWNGLMIGALSEAGEIELAETAATCILAHRSKAGKMMHQVAKGIPSGDAFLDDYACLIDGIISLANAKSLYQEVSPESMAGRSAEEWMREALTLVNEMVELFYDEEQGGFFSTSDRHEELFGRTKPVFDQPIPSANAIAIKVLAELGDQERAQKSLESFKGWLARAPQATEALHLAFMTLGSPIEEAPLTQALTITLDSKELKANESGIATGTLTITIPTGFHINANPTSDRRLIATEIKTEPIKATVNYPVSPNHQYIGTVQIPFEIQLRSGESGTEIDLTVKYQACTETECLLPEEKRFSLVVFR